MKVIKAEDTRSLIYGVSEAEKKDSLNICLVNYYLVYGTSETTARA